MGKKGLEGLDCTQHDGVYAWGVGSTRAAVRVEGVRWLRSPPHMRASPVTGHAEPDRRGPSYKPVQAGKPNKKMCQSELISFILGLQ
jgi:hypothetical protein